MNGNEREIKVSSLLATPEQPSSCPAEAGNPAAPYHWDEKDNHVKHLASLLRLRNTIDKEIAAVIGRPALTGHFGKFIATQVFDVGLHGSAVQKGSNGRFTNGPHEGKTVDIRYYPKLEGVLDINTESQPDFYLVLTGPRTNAASSRGTTRPWVIESAYLFDAAAFIPRLTAKIGIATSVRRKFWDEAEIYPRSNPNFLLTLAQRDTLVLFREAAVG